jgi:hypothetical protein
MHMTDRSSTSRCRVNVFYKRFRVKQYLKGGRATRIETVIDSLATCAATPGCPTSPNCRTRRGPSTGAYWMLNVLAREPSLRAWAVNARTGTAAGVTWSRPWVGVPITARCAELSATRDLVREFADTLCHRYGPGDYSARPQGKARVTQAGFDHDELAVYVWRSVRAGGCTRNGKPLAAGNIRRAFRTITTKAGMGDDWTSRELGHTFVSIMSDNDVPIPVWLSRRDIHSKNRGPYWI